MERFIRNEHDSCVMRMRLIYNGELTSEAGVPLSHIAVANGLPDPEEASFTEVLDAFRRLGYNTINIIIVKPGRRVSALRRSEDPT
jgi:hypothetical protein